MNIDLFSLLLIIFILSFAYTLHASLEFNNKFNHFKLQFHNNLQFHRKVDFNGPNFNWNAYLSAILIANVSIFFAQHLNFEPIEGIRYALFFVHYPIFIAWVIVHIMILRGEAFIESLRVPWET